MTRTDRIRRPFAAAVASTLALLTAPALAQDAPTAQAVFDTFAGRCQSIADDPEGAVSATFGAGGSAFGAITADKAVLSYQETIEVSDSAFGSLFFIRHQLPGGSVSYCNMIVSVTEPVRPIAFPELADLAAAAAEGLLGAPAVQRGSDVMQEGELGRMLLWTAGDSPNDPTLSLWQSSRLIQLSVQLPGPAN
jgi:hypothetical protein